MKRRVLSFLALACLPLCMGAQNTADSVGAKEYAFIMADSPGRLSSMRQSDQNYLSIYRMSARLLNDIVGLKTSALVQAIAGIITYPITHEEGHRAILTHEGVGSTSQPFFDLRGVAYVNGVTDQALINLRDAKLPVFIRLHTAGVESDYALAVRENSLMSWGMESLDVLWIEYFFRKTMTVSYYASGLLKSDAGIKEESDELKRDIVGHDIYGAIRHLHRPGMEYYRYTDYGDLTSEERRFANRVGWRSLLNLIDPMLLHKAGFTLGNGNRVNFMAGYGMAPFGDYIDEHFWFASKKIHMHAYLRQYENRSTWFPAMGADFANIRLAGNLYADLALHGWMQPEKLDFRTSSAAAGGAVDVSCKYRFMSGRRKGAGISVNAGIVAKTSGFLQEEAALDEHVGFNIGASLLF